MAVYPDPQPVILVPESIAAQAAYAEALLPGSAGHLRPEMFPVCVVFNRKTKVTVIYLIVNKLLSQALRLSLALFFSLSGSQAFKLSGSLRLPVTYYSAGEARTVVCFWTQAFGVQSWTLESVCMCLLLQDLLQSCSRGGEEESIQYSVVWSAFWCVAETRVMPKKE